MGQCKCTCRSQRRTSGILLCYAVPYSFKKGYLTEPRVSLAAKKIPEILLSLPGPTALSNKHTCDHSEVFYMGTGIQTQVLPQCLCCKGSYHGAVALVCHVPFFLSVLLSLNQLSLVNLISG